MTQLQLEIGCRELTVPAVILTLAAAIFLSLVLASEDASAVDWGAALNHSGDLQVEVQGIAADGDQVFVLAKGRPNSAFTLVHRWYDGTAWHDWEEVVSQASDVWEGEADICADGGRAHMAWIDRRGTADYNLYYTWFEDGTWGPQTKLDIDEVSFDVRPYEPSIVAEGGEVHIAWREVPSMALRIVYRWYDGMDWSQPEIVFDHLASSDFGSPDIALDGDTVHFVWKNQPGTGRPFDVLHRSYDGTTWSSPVMVNIDSQDENQDGPEVVAGHGMAHVVWYEESSGDWNVKYRGLEDGAWGPVLDLGPSGGLGNQNRSHIAMEGPYLFLVWQDDRDGTEGIYLRQFNGTDWEDEEEVTSDVAHPSQRPRVAVEGAVVHLAWDAIEDLQPHTYYRRGDLDSAPPSSTIDPLADS